MQVDNALRGDGGRLRTAGPNLTRLTSSRAAYAERWAINAAAYAAQGLFRQLAERLVPHIGGDRLADLGCGRGDGMATIRAAQPGASIIGIDENAACLAAVAERFDLAAPRERLTATGDDLYDLSCDASPVPLRAPVALVQSDLLRPDPALAAALGTIDAATLWFPGTHAARERDRLVHDHRLVTDEHYVVAVELAAVRFAVEHLKSGGCLQLVDRAAHRDPAVIAAAFRHRFTCMVEGTPLRLIELAIVRYREPATGQAVAVHALSPDRHGQPTWAVSAIFKARPSGVQGPSGR